MNITTEVMPGLFLIQAGKSYRGYMKSNAFLVDGRILIDTGPGGVRSPRRLLKALRAQNVKKLDYILLTHGHPDHVGGVNLVRENFGGRVAICREETSRSAINLAPDIYLEPDERLEKNEIVCLHAPGHSPGHFCFYFPEIAVLFSGDMVPGWGTTVISPPEGDMQSYISSLQNLARLKPLALLCPGHGPPIHEPAVKIEEIIRHRLERESQVRACLENGNRSIKAVLGNIYPELGLKMRPLARQQILAHLLKLQKEGSTRKTRRGWRIVGG